MSPCTQQRVEAGSLCSGCVGRMGGGLGCKLCEGDHSSIYHRTHKETHVHGVSWQKLTILGSMHRGLTQTSLQSFITRTLRISTHGGLCPHISCLKRSVYRLLSPAATASFFSLISRVLLTLLHGNETQPALCEAGRSWGTEEGFPISVTLSPRNGDRWQITLCHL